jgi:hypothetical protein
VVHRPIFDTNEQNKYYYFSWIETSYDKLGKFFLDSSPNFITSLPILKIAHFWVLTNIDNWVYETYNKRTGEMKMTTLIHIQQELGNLYSEVPTRAVLNRIKTMNTHIALRNVQIDELVSLTGYRRSLLEYKPYCYWLTVPHMDKTPVLFSP